MPDFRKAFFPTEEEKQKQKELLNQLDNQRISELMSAGLTKQEALIQREKDVAEYMNRGYYS